MADDVDVTNDRMEVQVAARIAAIRTSKKTSPKGVCYYCDAKVKKNALYCSDACQHDHTTEKHIRAKQGFR